MKKRVFVFLAALVFGVATAYAGNGDLVVNGKLGVGLSSPTSSLDVVGSGSYAVNSWGRGVRLSNASALFWAKGPLFTYSLGQSGDNLYFGRATTETGGSGSQSYDMVLASTGNIGIGTTTPGQKLDVNGAIRSNGDLYTTSPSGYAQTYLQSWGLRGDGTIYVEPAPGTTLYLTDQWSKTGTLNVQFGKSVFESGNVGIGTSNPQDKLHVEGNTIISGDTFFYSKDGSQRGSVHYGPYGKIGQPNYYNWSPDNGNPGLWIEGSNDGESAGIFLNGNTMVLWSPGDNDLLRVYDEDLIYNTQPTPHFVIDGSGNVGIRAAKTDGSYYSYALNVGGSAYATGYWQSSDSKLKENITPIDSALGKIHKMAGVSFTWKQESNVDKGGPDPKFKDGAEKKPSDEQQAKDNKRFPEGRHYGVIAQEIEKVLPEVVKEDADGIKAVNYSEIIPVLIEAIKEQQKQIEQLKGQVANLQK